MPTEIERAEQNIETRSQSLKKPLGLFDLVLTQILFVVGSSWVGAAAKLGQAHLFFWLLAILLFYIPQAVVVIYLSNRMPLEGGIYQWAKLGFNEFAGFIVAWNLWLLSITVIALGGMFATTNISYALGPGAAWMPDSKWCVSLIIALMFILGTSSVLAFIGNNPIDLIGPVPQTLRLGLRSFPIAGAIASIGIVLMTVRSISSTSVHVTGSSRLPMVAGWDHLLPSWFSCLHPRYKTPVNSIIFVGAITLVIAISSQIGAGIQEAFQLVDNAAHVFYGIVYFTMFAIPIFGAGAIRSGAPIWLCIAAICGALVSLSAIFFTIYPIIDVPSRLSFAVKIIALTAIANAIGIAIYLVGERRRQRNAVMTSR